MGVEAILSKNPMYEGFLIKFSSSRNAPFSALLYNSGSSLRGVGSFWPLIGCHHAVVNCIFGLESSDDILISFCMPA